MCMSSLVERHLLLESLQTPNFTDTGVDFDAEEEEEVDSQETQNIAGLYLYMTTLASYMYCAHDQM